MLLLFSGERVTTIHLLSPLHLPDKRHGTSLTWKRHMFSSYRVPSSDCRSHASLLAAATKESGAWLHALPVSSLGLRMDDHTTRIVVSVWVHLSVNPTSGTTVEVMLMPSLLMGSAASKAKVIFRGMLLSMPSYIGL